MRHPRVSAEVLCFETTEGPQRPDLIGTLRYRYYPKDPAGNPTKSR